ncbi:MAG: serine/threonine protein kinase [Magnetospirillum sp.]
MSADLCPWCFSDSGFHDGRCSACGWDPGKVEDGPYLPLGSVLMGKYQVGRPLGQGGFGITYLCWDLNLAVRVAVKEFYPQQLGSRPLGATNVTPFSGKGGDFTYGLNQFLAEARVLARFRDHPGIVSILDFFAANETGYMVMEHLDGCTFDGFLTSHGGKIAPDLAANILLPVMDALRAVHQEGLIHRDISPDNVFLLQDHRVKVLDFGAARQAVSSRSRALSVILKEGFAPLEQYQSNGNQGPWTDVYALAATFYRAVTGHLPPSSIDRLGTDSYQPPSALGIDIAPELEQVLNRGLSVQIEGRYPDMDSFSQALRAALAGQAPAPVKSDTVKPDALKPDTGAANKGLVPKADGPASAKLSPPLLAGAAAVLAIAAGGGFWLGGTSSTPVSGGGAVISAGAGASAGVDRISTNVSVPSRDVDPQVVARNLRQSASLLVNAALKQGRRDILADGADRLKSLAETAPDMRAQYEQSASRVTRLDQEIGSMVQEYGLALRALSSVSQSVLGEALEMETSQVLPDERLRPAYQAVGEHARALGNGGLSDARVRQDVQRLAKDFSVSR